MDDQGYTKAVRICTIEKVFVFRVILSDYNSAIIRKKGDHLNEWNTDLFTSAIDQVESNIIKGSASKGLNFGADFANIIHSLILGLNVCGGKNPCKSINHYVQ